jgi:MGT family glycosyltransferase
MTQARRFLLAMWEGGGTVPPELGVADRLAAAGHEIHVLGDPILRDRAEASGHGFTPWQAPPHRSTLDPDDDVFRDWELSNPLAMLRNARDAYMAGPAREFADETVAAIDAERPDAVLADAFILGAMVGAQACGLPVGVLMPNIWMLPTPGLTPVGPGFAPAKTFLGRTRDALVRTMANRIFDRGLPALNGARAAHGLDPIDHFWDQVRSCDRLFVLTSPTFDYGSAHVPDHAVYLGPILDDPAWAEPLDVDWSHPDRPLVLVALSSTFQDQASLLQRIVDALSTLPVRAVVTLGQMIDPSAVTSDNPDVVVVPSAPHKPLLEEASAVVTHCGHGTTLKALASGTPLVCIPMGRDQNDTAVRVTQVGGGVRVPLKASSDRIAAAVSQVLDDTSYTEAASKVATAFEREQATVDVVAEVEALANDVAARPALS